jgi:hypothetical protein
VEQGLKVTKVHRVLQYTQAPWMKPYIDLNTELRKKATNAFEKDFFKLMNNSVFGKTMENVRKRIQVDLVIDSDIDGESDKLRKKRDKLRKLTADPGFKSVKVFDNGLVAVHRAKSEVRLNKPIYVGQAVLDLSKILMYDFHYNVIKAQYGDKAQLLYTDTDSLIYEIETPDPYADMAKNLDRYDTSNYPTGHSLYSTANEKVVGKFKDECSGILILEFVGLRAKMYSIMTLDTEIKKAKGVSRVVVENQIKHRDYVQCLQQGNEMRHKMVNIKTIIITIITPVTYSAPSTNRPSAHFIVHRVTEHAKRSAFGADQGRHP